jgi:putative NADPH-quinone reductase
MNRTLSILGTSRSRGNTRLVLDAVLQGRAPVIDLNDHSITPYDYTHRNSGDDFLEMARQVVEADTVVFATPVYWYSMSAQLKTFLDRLTDLTRVHKVMGRSLKGKSVFLVASSSSPELPPGFEVPFELTAGYLGMRWGGAFHAYFEADLVLSPEVEAQARAFGQRIF